MSLSVAALRRHVVAAQGYTTRYRTAGPDDVAAAIRRLSAVQLDSISTVERAHRLTLLSRVGRYPPRTVSALLRSGRVFEYWAHEACLLPIEDWPLARSRMLSRPDHPWWGDVIDRDRALADRIMGEIRERGPLGSRHFEGGPNVGGMWNLKPAKRMLEALWSSGRLVIGARDGFQRMYDLPERVIPDEVLGAPVPGRDEVMRGLVLRAVQARGALTESGVVEHWRLKGGVAAIRPFADALVAAGKLRREDVGDGGAPVLLPADADVESARPAGTVLLSPFDNLLWDRPFAERVLGFSHLIEVYKPAPERRYGYYVLPLVIGDRVAGRADVKADRKAGVLRLQAWHPESRRRSAARDEALERAFARLARQLALEPAAG
ncbi:MAG TPA: crosslink repair DNA glycosylase YcaQ family protein [Gaiellales bacterium]|nr:crosslink repair DNA glycosylase YcaQ family protein [Gaiellales bacterium]